MPYILSAQLDDEDTGDRAFGRYLEYLASVRDQMPPGAFALACSDWYFNSADHRAPHDAWLDQLTITERPSQHRRGLRTVEIALRLLGAYHDAWIEFRYRDVSSYRLDLSPVERDRNRGHRDWRHDEFRLASAGRVEHEIEWWGVGPTGTWLIEAADVEFTWQPIERNTAGDIAT